MRKIFVVAGREYTAAVKTKSFFISLLILPLMMGGSIVMQRLLRNQVDTETKQFAVIDRTPNGSLFAALQEANKQRTMQQVRDPQSGKQILPIFELTKVDSASMDTTAIAQERFDLSERVRRKELFGFLEIGKSVAGATADPSTASPGNVPDEVQIRYQSNSPTNDAFPKWAEQVLGDAILQHRFGQVQPSLQGEKLKELLKPIPVQSKGLTSKDKVTGAIIDAPDENQVASFLIPFGLMMLMFMMILVGATPLMQGVVEEKMQRIAEVLLGSVRPFELMLGKLLGMVAVSLTLAACYLGAAFWAAHHYGLSELLSPTILSWFVVYQGLAVLMYGSLFIAVGAACTDMRETQSMMWPVMLLVSLPMFVWINAVREPNSAFSTGFSFFPFATPMLMIIRQAVPPGIPVWQPLVGMIGVLLTTLICVYIAGRIFRMGILLQGKGANPSDLVRWIFRG